MSSTEVIRMSKVTLLTLCALALSLPPPSAAQTYPAKQIRLIAPFPPGGGTDIIARLIQDKFSQALGQQVIVDNRPGASGIPGTELVAKAAPDGYVLGMGTSNTLAANPSMFPKLPYDPRRDFALITQIAIQPNLLAVHPSLPARNLKELLALAKKRPGQLNYGSSGNCSSHHLSGELLKLMGQVDLVHVPYKGTGTAIADAVGGHIELVFAGTAALMTHVKAGRLRPIGVTAAKRVGSLPEIPTIAEGGLPGYEISAWHGMIAPAGTPAPIVNRLSAAVSAVLADAEIRKRFAVLGAEPVGSTPEAFTAFLNADIDRLGKLIRAANIKAD
jgi:tripartite-type tricarboxylate transporter receptor subunit TctC